MFIKSSEGKITKGVFTYYIITEGEGGGSKMLMDNYRGWGRGWPCDDIS